MQRINGISFLKFTTDPAIPALFVSTVGSILSQPMKTVAITYYYGQGQPSGQPTPNPSLKPSNTPTSVPTRIPSPIHLNHLQELQVPCQLSFLLCSLLHPLPRSQPSLPLLYPLSVLQSPLQPPLLLHHLVGRK